MDKQKVAQLFKSILGEQNVKVDEPMSIHTSFRIGGPADILISPRSADDIVYVINTCKNEGIPYFIMGNGTNLIVRDKGIRGVVVKIYENFNSFSVKDGIIEAEAGILLSKISNIALQHGLSGLEFASGIPGTLGGAVAMNAGAYGGEMKDVVVRTEYIGLNGEMKTLQGDQHQFGYRSSVIQSENGIVLKSVMQLKRSDKQAIKDQMDDLTRKRKEKQPLNMPSAGSVFKRPEGYFAGKLVEDCGLRGYRIGGAEVSCLHCGFIVNAGDAKAEDVLKLIAYIQKEVSQQFGVNLETEVKIVGEE